MILSKKDFLKRFTAAEYGTVKAAAAASTDVDYYWQLFLIAEDIDTDDPDTIGGLGLLEVVGLLAAGRAAEILGTATTYAIGEHSLAPCGDTATDACFRCTRCGQSISFNKDPLSDPHASEVDGVWTPPENAHEWMAPCT